MAHQNANEHISMLEVLLAESNQRIKEQALKTQIRIKELEEQLTSKNDQIQKLMESKAYARETERHMTNINTFQHQVVIKGGGNKETASNSPPNGIQLTNITKNSPSKNDDALKHSNTVLDDDATF